MFNSAFSERGRDILFRVFDVLDTHDTPEEDVFRGVVCVRRHDTGTIDEIDAFHKCNVLPDFGLSRNRGNGGDLFLAKGVDNGGFAGVGIADQAD